MKRIKYIVPIVVCIVLLYSISNPNKAEGILRFHVIANSNSSFDQKVKAQVKTQIYSAIQSKIKDVKTEGEALLIIKENEDVIIETANRTLREKGAGYSAKIEIGNFEFPTKSYGKEDFPAGKYDAVKIVLGEGKGENWWCVLFPPICFIDASFSNEKDFSIDDVENVEFKSILSEILGGK